ncbi:hypothetical protein LWI28_018679 [Acer negundo]|uniref:Leucine-rich repeat-containing N-terminal plant-type domain-containing protein n=1 Tax=Acer negundo TaxID=4023 RepID=A0AAD5NW39_ACENE|nr:hypothetical protein LWI28_018679 [Acer negundo]
MWGSLLWYLVQFLPFCISYLQVVSSSSSLNSSFQSGKLCSSQDSFALLHFKNTISINTSASSHCNNYAVSYPKTHSWKQGSDCCSWDGVTCDRFTGHVTALDLSSSRLLGTVEVNSSLFLLRNLKKLNLACNDFQGSRMSSKFGQFTYLTHLNLSSSSFSGLVPVEISQLSKLLSVDFSNNTLKLEQPNFVKFLQNITEVRDLVLDFVDMSLVAPGSLVNLSSSLISLSLRHNYLQGEFPNEVLHLPFLQKLILSENIGLTGTFPVSNWSSPLRLFNLSFTSFSGKLPDTIGNLLNLNVLDLAFCNFEGPVPASFWNLTQITSLVLTSNHFTGQISASLSNLVQLTDLYLRHNMFSGQFPDVFRNLRKVKYLDLSQNNFSGQLPLSAFNLTQLSSLDFSDNQLVGLGYNNFTGSLDQSQSQALAGSLKYFLLGHNEIQGPIPNSIFKLVNLTFLDLSSNNLSGVLNIDMFSKLKNLKSVYLSHNNLLSLASHNNVSFRLPKLEDFRCSSCNITEFPSFLKASENLKFLDLSNNSIPGRITRAESKLWLNLFHLNLSTNLLTSFEQIPSMSLGHLDLHSNLLEGPLVPLPPTIWCFSAANNKLTGEIPPSFCEFNSVGYIDLSNNRLTGMIPQCLASYGELSVLDLRLNNFYGSIPQTFSRSYRLASLNLNGNQLEGPLPPSLANCSSLQVLNVGNNRIEDGFPHWLATLPDLQILILRSNRFHGPIDDSQTRNSLP